MFKRSEQKGHLNFSFSFLASGPMQNSLRIIRIADAKIRKGEYCSLAAARSIRLDIARMVRSSVEVGRRHH